MSAKKAECSQRRSTRSRAIEQASNATVLLVPDELLLVMKELQAHYDRRAQWQEPIRG